MTKNLIKKMSKKELLDKFNENKEDYRVSELWWWTHEFVRDIFDNIFMLKSVSRFSHEKDLFGFDIIDNIYQHELKKWLGNRTRADFLCKINGKRVVVEVEAYGGMEKWLKQIPDYMTKENTEYAIVTDWYERRFFKQWYSEDPDKYTTKTLEELLWEDGKFLDAFYNTHDYYIHRLSNVQGKAFNAQDFHPALITIAESLVYDFRYSWLFKSETKDENKVEIQTAYSLIIQFILLKIIQDKKQIKLIKKDEVLEHLKENHYTELFQTILKEIEWLGWFYESYHNQQAWLIQKIIKHYSDQYNIPNFNLDTVRPFLDLYQFIFSFNFEKVNQDFFWAVYENYLKELYHDDGTKKWQVFTPPEIVDFMLDEVWYTHEFIKETIENYWLEKIKPNLENIDFNIPGLSIIDPACWSGTFLYKAAGRILNAIYLLKGENKISESEAGKLSECIIVNNIIGFDIEAFPLYLAEMNILQTLLFFNVNSEGDILNKINKTIKLFSTQDSISEFFNINESMIDALKGVLENKFWTTTLFEKRDNREIFEIKSDLQNIDKKEFEDYFAFSLHVNELKRNTYLVENKKSKKQKTFWDVFWDKVLEECKNIKDLNNFLKKYAPNVAVARNAWLDRGTGMKNREHFNQIIEKANLAIDVLIKKDILKRSKFDFVIGNPPYVAYNMIDWDVKNNRVRRWLNMWNVFGVNLHSIPWNRKKYSPKPNLYSYFNALSFWLAKENWKVCFIVPEWFVAYDCNNRFLLNQVNLEKLIFFNQRIFVNRWILGNVETATSAIIYSYSKSQLNDKDIEICSYNWEISTKENGISLDDIIKKLEKKHYTKKLARDNIISWFGVLKRTPEGLDLIEKYKDNSDDLNIYYDVLKSKETFGDSFYFDIWYNIDESTMVETKDNDYINFLWRWLYYSYKDTKWWTKDKSKIWLLQANQWYNLLESKYKIIRNKTVWFWNEKCFYFEDREVIWARNNFNWIWSNNKDEILYLFGILNSKMTRNILNLYNKKGWEIRDFWIFLYTLKSQIRVPKIDFEIKQQLKQQLIINSENIVNLCKNWGQLIDKWSDICKTELDTNSMAEKIIWIKDEYKSLLGDIDTEKLKTSDIIPAEIKEKIGNESLELKRLEEERDGIVMELYGMSE